VYEKDKMVCRIGLGEYIYNLLFNMVTYFKIDFLMWKTNYSINVEIDNKVGAGNYWTQTSTWDKEFNTKITAKD